MKKKYSIISSGTKSELSLEVLEAFEKQVDDALAVGWRPQGGLQVVIGPSPFNSGYGLFQAMICDVKI